MSKPSFFVLLCWIYVALMLGPYVPNSFAQESKTQTGWDRIADDLELLSFNLKPASLFSAQLIAVRTSLKRYRLAAIRASDFNLKSSNAKNLCKLSRGLVCINANFFDEQGRPLGLLISRGILHHAMHNSGRTLTGVLQATRDSIAILPRTNFNPSQVIEAVQAGPRLLSRGQSIKTNENDISRRSGVCITPDRKLILFAVISTWSGVSIPELQGLLKAAPLECWDALNLDGGGSTQLYISSDLAGASSQFEELYFPGRDEVPVMVGLFMR